MTFKNPLVEYILKPFNWEAWRSDVHHQGWLCEPCLEVNRGLSVGQLVLSICGKVLPTPASQPLIQCDDCVTARERIIEGCEPRYCTVCGDRIDSGE